MESTLEDQHRVLGPEALHTLTTLNNLALTYRGLERLDKAAAAQREECSLGRRILGDDHPEVLILILNPGWVLVSSNQHEDAESILMDALGKVRGALPPILPLVAVITTAAGEAALAAGGHDEAMSLFLRTRFS